MEALTQQAFEAKDPVKVVAHATAVDVWRNTGGWGTIVGDIWLIKNGSR